MIGRSAAHLAMLQQLRRIAASVAPTLIEGETGSGKELAARAIHYGGPRRSGPFVPVNCGALPETLIESELFGHERGAFTDARTARQGLVAEARGGTLFLDEVDALSPKAQVTLLRFLQDQRYRPLGHNRELSTDVRLIAAANRPLETLVAQAAFRADLMYRLKILHLWLPPLRERAGDAEWLALHFVARFALKYGLAAKPLHESTVQWMAEYDWPGNVRELENWVHRELLMSSSPSLEHAAAGPGSSPASAHGTPAGGQCPAVRGAQEAQEAPEAPEAQTLHFHHAKTEAVRLFERDYLQRVLRSAHGNVTRAAQLAGKERRAFGKLMKKHGIARDCADAGGATLAREPA